MPRSKFLHRLCPPRFLSQNVSDEFQKRRNNNKEETGKRKQAINGNNIG